MMQIPVKIVEFFFSLKCKLILSIGLILMLVLGISVLGLGHFERKQLLDSSKKNAEFISNLILKYISLLMLEHKSINFQEVLKITNSLEIIDGIWILGENEEILENVRGDKEKKIILSNLFKNKNDQQFILIRAHERNLVSMTPIKNESKCMSCHHQANPIIGYLAVKIPIAAAEKEVRLTKRIQIANGIIMFVFISGGIIFFFARFYTPVIKELTDKIIQVQEGDLKVQFKSRRKDELSRLGQDFNNMVNRLREIEMKMKISHQEQLERVDRLANVGELAAGVAHEINNPTCIILTRVGYLLYIAQQAGLSKSVIADLKAIENLTIRITKITRGLLNFSRTTAFNPHDISLNELVDKLLLILEPRLKLYNVKLFKNLIPGYSEIQADSTQIEHVILNLVNNAVDAMPSGGNLMVKTERVDDEKRIGYIRLSILDTGMGIPPENLDKIFIPFFTTKEEGKGTGLGLAISYEIIKAHGGRIEVKSHPSKGSEFLIYLPLLITPS